MTVYEFLSVVIAFVAILLSVVTAIQNRSHNRRSVRPALVIRYHLGGSKGRYGISVKNEGLGPALIKHLELKIEDEVIMDVGDNGWLAVKKKFDLNDTNTRHETIFPDGIIPSGERVWLLSTEVNESYYERIKKVSEGINIIITYESLYSEQFVQAFRKVL